MKHQQAFTLLEALIALTIITIVAAFTFPAAQHLLQRGQDEATRTALVRMIYFAREQADTRHQSIIICKTQDGLSCGGAWSDGQLVFVDDEQDGEIHQTEQIIMKQKMKVAQGQLHARFYPRYRDYIQFQPTNIETMDNGTWWYCHAHDKLPVWAITVNRVGGVNTHFPDAQGEIYDTQHNLLIC